MPDKPAEEVVILKVWGGAKPWSDSIDPIPRFRVVIGMETGVAVMDQDL